MITERINLYENDEYSYELAYGFVPNIRLYLHEDSTETDESGEKLSEKKRPFMLVVPGGGYCMVSPTEGYIVAKKFYDAGYQTAVITYTTNLPMTKPLLKCDIKNFKPEEAVSQPMKDLARAIRIIRNNSGEYGFDPERLAICGFSAGGHLCGCMATKYDTIIDSNEELNKISCKPNAAILSYPVISSGEYAHQDSFRALLGIDAYDNPDYKELMKYYSLEYSVTKDTVPCFLWQTDTDDLVPVENSHLFARALHEKKVPHALHIFPKGEHGLSVADQDWADCNFGEPYNIEQQQRIAEEIKAGRLKLPKDKEEYIVGEYGAEARFVKNYARDDVAVWPGLAIKWLEIIMG